MESLVNYESDDGDKKYKKKKVQSKELTKNDASATGSHRHGRKRIGSTNDFNLSDDDSSSTKKHANVRQDLSEESNQSPKRSSAKNKKNGHEKVGEKPNFERDNGNSDGKRRKDDRAEKKRDRHASRERERGRERDQERNSRSHSGGYDDRHHKEKHKNKDKYDKRDRHDDRGKSDRRDKNRRSDDRKPLKNDRKIEDNSNGAPLNRMHSPKQQRDNQGGDYNWRKESPSTNYQSEKQLAPSTNQLRPHHDDKDSRTKFAMQKAEAISRNIERRANEKVHQLQKLGIEVPGITALQQPSLQQQPQQQHVGQNTHIRFSSPQQTATVTSPETAGTAANITTDDNCALNMANFTSPVLVNPRYTEQMQKKKLIWGAKKAAAEQADKITTTNKWETAKFSQDNDGKMASKFLRLMGMKGASGAAPPVLATKSDDSSEETATVVDPSVQKRQEMFSTMEQQYEVARQATHTMRGMGLGFGSSRPY